MQSVEDGPQVAGDILSSLIINGPTTEQALANPRLDLSQDPNDPLNWPKGRKYWHLFVILSWCFIVNASIAWTSPAWATWVQKLGMTYVELNNAQGILVFLCAFGVLLCQPWTLKYGRRLPCVVASALILVGLGVGLSMTGIGQFSAYCALAGFASAPAYATNTTSVIDVTPQHRCSTWLGVYALVLLLGNFLPPVAAGYIIDSQGWEWCFRWLLLLMGLATLLLVFGAEETLYVRDDSGSVITSTAFKSDSCRSTGAAEIHEQPAREKRNYWQRMTLFHRNPQIKMSYWKLTISPFHLVVLPAVVWTSTVISLGTFLTSFIFATQASFFAAPPYNFDSRKLGLMYFAVIIGMTLGAVWGGYFCDWLVIYLARRNKGIAVPEQRLWAYWLVSFTASAGVILYGVGASYGWHWAIPCLGLGLVGFALNAGFPISMAYTLDCYNELSGEIIQLVNVLRNLVGGAMTFVIQPWIDHNGARNTCVIIAVLVFFLNSTSVIFQIWGKQMRIATANRYKMLAEQERHF